MPNGELLGLRVTPHGLLGERGYQAGLDLPRVGDDDVVEGRATGAKVLYAIVVLRNIYEPRTSYGFCRSGIGSGNRMASSEASCFGQRVRIETAIWRNKQGNMTMAEFSDLVGFEERVPSHQNAVDFFSGSWCSQFPPPSGLVGGAAQRFDDVRVTWAASVIGGLNGLSIVELDPFEAYNTYQFQMAGAANVISIESSRMNFLKCLIVKNIFGLAATFLHGDFQKFLVSTPTRFDVCWASGALYHMTQPIELLQGVRRVANIAFIWTHYYDAGVLASGGNTTFSDPSRNRIVEFDGRPICLHHRDYHHVAGTFFSGGESSYSYWLERNDSMFILDRLGYNSIVVGVDNPNHPPGPAMFFPARVVPGHQAPVA